MLCEVCLGVLQRRCNKFDNDGTGMDKRFIWCGHHRTSRTLEQATLRGCYICNYLWQTLSIRERKAVHSWHQNPAQFTGIDSGHGTENPSTGLKEEDFFTTMTFWKINKGNMDILVKLRTSRHSNTSRTSHCFDLNILPAQSVSSQVKQHVTSQETLSEQSLQQAKIWLDKCSFSHTQCNKQTSSRLWYPTRLLYIERAGDNQTHVRLMHTALEQPNGPYMTLSHRWGSTDFIKLTRNTITPFSQDIPLASLPQTFADAILVTLRLDIHYLWIDSLCIIQDEDDLSDWLHEARLMQDVYSHSHCNIFASVAEDGSEGLSRSRNPQGLYTSAVSIPVVDSHTQVASSRLYLPSQPFLWRHRVVNCHLNTRGWVFQESLLTPRILYFSQDQLYWECRQLRACEVHSEGHASLIGPDDDAVSLFKTIFYTNALSETSRSADLTEDADHGAGAYHGIWWGLVEVYSATFLTKPHDKLVALSGVAKRMSTCLKDEYVVGMWRKTLERDLWWRSDDKNGTRPAIYRAPSWSWASIDGGIRNAYIHPLSESLVHVTDVVLHHTADNFAGLVTGGWVDLRGRLRKTSLTWEDEATPYRWCAQSATISASTADITVCESVHLDVRSQDNQRTIQEDDANHRLYCMLTSYENHGDSQIATALLLRIVDSQDGIFERIGMINTWFPDMSTITGRPKLLDSQEHDVERLYPCLSYNNGLHTIRII